MSTNGFGVTLKYDTVGSSTFASTIAGVIDITPPKQSATDIKTTTHDTADRIDTFMSGTIDPGTADATVDYAAATETTIRSLVGVMKAWKITYSDGSTCTFDGYVKENGDVVPMDDRMTITFSIKVSGGHTFTEGA